MNDIKPDLQKAFQDGVSSAEIKTHKQAIIRALLVGSVFSVALFSPFGIFGKAIVFILLMFIVGIIASK